MRVFVANGPHHVCTKHVGCYHQESSNIEGENMKVIVVGGGTSGLMASVSAANAGAEVLLLEKNTRLGRKLLLTGGTRCNVTNNRSQEEIIKQIPGNGRFLYSAFSQFDNLDIINFFESRGVRLKEEDHGRLFPTTDSAKTILNTFIEELKRLRIQVRTNVSVKSIRTKEGQFAAVVLESGEEISGDAVILATGGKSYPKTGSTGSGYRLAKSVGHTITPLFATEVPLISSEKFIKEGRLRGLSLRNVALSVLNAKQKAVVTHQMDMIFTHFGVSGPAVLRCSSFVYLLQQKEQKRQITMRLNVQPNLSQEDLELQWEEWLQTNPKKSIKTYLKEWMPERYGEFLLEESLISPQKPIEKVTKQERERLLVKIHDFRFYVDGSLPIEKGFVTGGGVQLKEIDPRTLASKKTEGVYFCGELLDIHGYTGGYNITAAFVTGYVAGLHAARGW